jgi:predicted  nucleic acid-binding Zn-ribbon protein
MREKVSLFELHKKLDASIAATEKSIEEKVKRIDETIENIDKHIANFYETCCYQIKRKGEEK